MQRINNQQGSALLMVLAILAISLVGTAALTSLTSSQATQVDNSLDHVQALYLAEAAVEKAKLDFVNSGSALPLANANVVQAINGGEYYYSGAADSVSGNNETDVVLVGYGAVPSFDDPESIRVIKSAMQTSDIALPQVFDDAIYAVDDIQVNGNSHTVNGDTYSGDDTDCNPAQCGGITGDITETNDPNHPFPDLNYQAFKAASIAQGNYIAQDEGIDNAPTSFYHTPPNGSDPGVPNIVFIEDNLTVGPNDDIGGFIIVAGDFLTNPNWDFDGAYGGKVEINGKAFVDGVIWSVSDFTKNGGGNVVNVDGGVICLNDATLNGKANIQYNAAYMNSIENLEVASGELDEIYWNEYPIPDGITKETWWSTIQNQIVN